jgi:hypothetical protein
LGHGIEEGATVSANKVGVIELLLLVRFCEGEPP